ncbi:MAG: hypothetical protein B7Z80_14470 [Rhodospirillales bacterium 20-64-7]|nr:MAG: hypothetical protein B7Z80_14470 [Rhodospirillales bacterium 20-64-7]
MITLFQTQFLDLNGESVIDASQKNSIMITFVGSARISEILSGISVGLAQVKTVKGKMIVLNHYPMEPILWKIRTSGTNLFLRIQTNDYSGKLKTLLNSNISSTVAR